MDDHRAAYPLQDAQGDVVSLIHMPLGVGASPAEVAAQWTYSPYGEVLTYEQFHPHPVVVFGHKSLVADRLDAPALSWDTATSSLSDTQRLMPGAKLISYARNRTYSPSLGRWLQQDPNGSGQTTTATRFRGESEGLVVPTNDIAQRRRDGLNVSGYARFNPVASSDSSGLYSTGEAVEDFYGSNLSLPTPGPFIQGALSALVTDYSANLEWDIDWASDWSMDDEAHTRNSNVWVYLAIGIGIYDGFEFGFGDYKINILDPVGDYLMAGKSGGGGGGKGGGKGPRGSRPNPRTHPGSHVSGSGPYSHLPDHPSTGAGRDFTATQRKKILNANADRNGGRLRSDVTGRFLSRSPGSPNSAQVDHIKPQSLGGSNSNSNAQVVEAHWNQSKGNRR